MTTMNDTDKALIEELIEAEYLGGNPALQDWSVGGYLRRTPIAALSTAKVVKRRSMSYRLATLADGEVWLAVRYLPGRHGYRCVVPVVRRPYLGWMKEAA